MMDATHANTHLKLLFGFKGGPLLHCHKIDVGESTPRTENCPYITYYIILQYIIVLLPITRKN